MAEVIETDVQQKVFEIDTADPPADKDELANRIRAYFDQVPDEVKLPDEKTKVTLRIFTRRC